MASSRALLPVLLLLLAVVVSTASGVRPATTRTAMTFVRAAPAASLAERLEGEGPQQCWEVLMDIKSCTGEIILFFLNGEAYLGPGCCRAIRVIEQRCWAADAMLSFIGFTPEGDMLKGYCDAGDAGDDDNDGHHQSFGGSSAPPPSGSLDDVATDGTATAAGRKVRLGSQLDG